MNIFKQKIMLSGLLCLILFLFTQPGFALETTSTTKIQGRISCSVTGHAISNAHISAEISAVMTTSDSDGNFTLKLRDISIEETLLITHINFYPSRIPVQATMTNGFQTITLDPKQHGLRPVTVVSHRVMNQPVDRLQTADATFKPIDSGAFLMQAPNVSGVRRGGFGLDPVVRGFGNSRLNIRVDGLTSSATACPNRMDPPTSHIRITDIERVEIHHGPHALQFGPSFGGTVNFVKHERQQSETLTLSGDVRAGLESNTGHRLTDSRISISNQNFDIMLSGGLSSSGNYTSGDGTTTPAGFESYDYGVDLSVNLSEAHLLSAGWSQSFVRDADFPALGMDMAVDDTYKITMGYKFRPTNTRFIRQLKVNGYHNMVDHIMNNHQRESFVMRDAEALAETRSTGFQMNMNGLTQTGTWTIIGSFDRVSIEGNRFVTFKTGPNAGNSTIYSLWQDSHINNSGLYAGTEQFLGRWTISAGLRFDHNTADAADPAPRFQNRALSSEHFNISFSGGISHSLNSNTRISMFAGRGVRSPDVTERFINFLALGRNAFEYAGNPDLKPEANHQVDFIFETRVRQVNLRMNAFAAYTTNYISAVINPDLNPVGMGVPGVREFINAGDAIFTGFEFAANSRLFDLLNVDLGASYTFAEYTDSGDPVAEIAPFETTMRLSGILFNRVSPMLNVRKVFPQGRFDAAFGEERTSGFWLVDVEAGYSILSGLRLNAGVRNLFDEAYMEHLNRNFTPEFNTERNKLMEPGRRVFVEISYRF